MGKFDFDIVSRGALSCLVVVLAAFFFSSAFAEEEEEEDQDPIAIHLFNVHREGRALYVLGDNFSYCLDRTGDVIKLPSGFVTDFASIPWPARLIITPDGPVARAAIIHDYLYAVGEPDRREYADEVLLAAMKDYGVGNLTKALVYNAVRAGGRGGYGRSEDWSFYDASKLKPVAAPPKPKGAVHTNVGAGCVGYQKLAQGWRS